MKITIRLECRSGVYYLTGNTFPIRERIKETFRGGAAYSREQKGYQVPDNMEEEARLFVETINAEENEEDLSEYRVYGKVQYKSRSYYCIAVSEKRLRLCSLNGQIDFWADISLCTWEKRYQPRQYQGRDVYQTIGSIRKFVDEQKGPNAKGRCTECDAWGLRGQTCTECHEGTYV